MFPNERMYAAVWFKLFRRICGECCYASKQVYKRQSCVASRTFVPMPYFFQSSVVWLLAKKVFVGLTFDPERQTFQIQTTSNSIIDDFSIFLKNFDKPLQKEESSADNTRQLESQSLKLSPGTSVSITRLEIQYKIEGNIQKETIDDPKFIEQIPSFTTIESEKRIDGESDATKERSTATDNLLWIALALIFIPTGILFFFFFCKRAFKDKTANDDAVQWVKILKFVVGVLDWWTDVLFCIFLYHVWQDSKEIQDQKNKETAFMMLFCFSAVLLVVSWINQLVGISVYLFFVA